MCCLETEKLDERQVRGRRQRKMGRRDRESSRWPDSICGVVWQDKQFSWTHDGKSDTINVGNKLNRLAWMKSVFYAVMAMIENDVTNGATHYHSTSVKPYWADSMMQTAIIGNHIFYREE